MSALWYLRYYLASGGVQSFSYNFIVEPGAHGALWSSTPYFVFFFQIDVLYDGRSQAQQPQKRKNHLCERRQDAYECREKIWTFHSCWKRCGNRSFVSNQISNIGKGIVSFNILVRKSKHCCSRNIQGYRMVLKSKTTLTMVRTLDDESSWWNRSWSFNSKKIWMPW